MMSSLVPFRGQKGDAPWPLPWTTNGTSASDMARSAMAPLRSVLKPLVHRGTGITLLEQPRAPEPAVRLVAENGHLDRRLFDALAAMKIKTAEVAMHLSAEWRERLFSYLDFLHDVEDWNDADEPANLASFTTFLRLVLHLKPQKRPGMGLTTTGNLVITWTIDNRHLTFECLADDEVLWSVVVPDSDGVETAAGRCRIQRLEQVLAPYQPQRWFANVG